jgi:hypothetical protein
MFDSGLCKGFNGVAKGCLLVDYDTAKARSTVVGGVNQKRVPLSRAKILLVGGFLCEIGVAGLRDIRYTALQLGSSVERASLLRVPFFRLPA